MARTKVFKKQSTGDVEFNMTPMIDCTFLLIIFFILSASVLSDALAQLELHRPYKSQARDDKALNALPNRVIVNVVSDAKDKFDKDSLESSTIKEYMINGEIIPVRDRDKLIKRIRQGAIIAKDNNEENFYVEIRADHRVNFGAVQEVLKAAAKGGIRGINMKMNITALIGKKGT
ncbi:MAG: biopolymer transporter ExbD [Phycisphaerae bacterium]|jgi:biopolymer transport protein ExbD|nr:biopolymer transporter ExbD [Phycisphaerae bacterium]MDP7288012.1 biopolymer transporter ExbD [Phycisphaerae bacterium]